MVLTISQADMYKLRTRCIQALKISETCKFCLVKKKNNYRSANFNQIGKTMVKLQ